MRRDTWMAIVGTVFLVGLVVVPAVPSAENDVDPMKLMQKSDERHRIDALESKLKYVLQKEGGKKRVRKTRVKWVQNDETGDRVRIEFTAPKDIEGLTLLTVENKRGGDDEQWLFTPAFDKTRRIGVADLGDRFAGTDLFYEDLKRRYPDDYSYKFLGMEKVDGHACYVLLQKPSAEDVKENSPYGKAKVWLRKDILYPVKVAAFDREGEPHKKFLRTDLSNVAGKAWRWGKMQITDIQRKHRTTVVAEERTVKKGFDDGTFSKHSLDE